MKRIKDINKAKSIVIILSLVLMVLLIHFSSNNKFEKKDFNNASVLIKANDCYELSKVYLRDEEYEKSKNEFNKAKAL